MVPRVGFIEGSLENVFYGLHHRAIEPKRMTTTFVNKSILDTAVLATLEHGSDGQPFRYMGLKWRIVRTPGWEPHQRAKCTSRTVLYHVAKLNSQDLVI